MDIPALVTSGLCKWNFKRFNANVLVMSQLLLPDLLGACFAFLEFIPV